VSNLIILGKTSQAMFLFNHNVETAKRQKANRTGNTIEAHYDSLKDQK
jgi:hypothetical protein